MLRCRRCEKNLKDGSKFCSACGAEVKSAAKCLKCGTEYEDDAKFCSECGSVVSADASLFGEFIDHRDGKKYRTVKMDSKIWMAENLNYSGKDGSTGESCDNDYSRVYNWATAQDICPEGWRLPSFKEWYELLKRPNINNDFYRDFGVGKNEHWWCADEDSPDRGSSWHSSYSGFVSNNSHKLCLLKVRCVKV